MTPFNTVNIRPSVNVLSILPHLNYKAWFALAEFVDNSIQSSIAKRKDLEALYGRFNYKLRVDINFNTYEKSIVIYDNAAGISSSEFQRAFRPAEIPLDTSGLSEFGMGMKSAACWFSPKWSVRSSALGENIERTVIFDIDQIVNDSIEDLHVISSPISTEKHYTEICLRDINAFPKGPTISKIKKHLASIYRIFLREGQLEINLDSENLSYVDPMVLSAPYYVNPDGPQIEWKKEIKIDLGKNKIATGFVAIREKASTSLAGLALFRRNRLVLGSVDETYRPRDIFGNSNSFTFQRIFGEIHLKGFNVSHSKDGIKWEESEDIFLSELRKQLLESDMPILLQAREYRTRKDVRNVRETVAEVGQNLAKRFDHNKFFDTKNIQIESPPKESEFEPLTNTDREESQFEFNFRDEPWIVKVELSFSDKVNDWLSIKYQPSIIDPEPRQVVIRVSMLHPFMVQYSNLDSEGLSAVLNIAASMALSEVLAEESAEHHPSTVRRYTNEILKNLVNK
ncbi:MAG: ATP-binding protein [Paracoccaceae bacterium]|nr:ATP-binding protein [Paracoccaceae bacterium]MDE2675434.1 ATP-binding protein [Paracoccaceae bacterium]